MDTPKSGFWARENENPHQTNVFSETADPNLILEYPFKSQPLLELNEAKRLHQNDVSKKLEPSVF